MKKFPVFMLLSLISPIVTQAQLRIVATTPDLADVARKIGGDLVKVDTLAKGTEDLHAVPMRPSFIPKLAYADGVVHLGLGAEHVFLPALLEAAANPQLNPGRKGDIDCSRHLSVMDIPTAISRAFGDQHPDGNPHYNTDPRNGKHISLAIAEGFFILDPSNKDVYEKNRLAFDRELDRRMKKWGEMISATKGVKAISYHKDMVYFADYLGMELVGEIEPMPGIAPSPKHLAELVGKMNKAQVKLILFGIQYSKNVPEWLASQTKAKMVPVATMGGAFPDSVGYFGMIEHNIQSVVEALSSN